MSLAELGGGIAAPHTPIPIRPEPERDGLGRYKLPDPATGKIRSWSRVTTFARTASDTFALTKWQLRKTAIGLAQRHELMALAASIEDPDGQDGKKKLDDICEKAMEAGGRSERSTLGTALHSFTEALDSGRKVKVPPPWDRDIDAYRTEIRRAGIEVSPNYVERVCVLPGLGLAGTMDRAARVPFEGRSDVRVMDVKSGADLKYSFHEIAIQLACYAHAEWIWDPIEQRYHRMLPVAQDWALVAHLPAGEARCTFYRIDIEAGWEAVQVCLAVKSWRNRKDLAAVLRTER